MAKLQTCPRHVKAAGKKYWKEQLPRLRACGVVNDNTIELFTQLCECIGYLDELRSELKHYTDVNEKTGVRRLNPTYTAILETQKRIEHIGNKLKIWGAESARRRKFEHLGEAVDPDIIPIGDGARKRG